MRWDAVRRWALTHRSAILTATSSTVIVALIATVAAVSGGYEAQRLDLDDGSVWVANGGEQVVGRANMQVKTLDTVVPSSGADIQVVQDASTVLVLDRTEDKVDIIDQATAKLADSVPMPPEEPEVFLAGDAVVVLARGTGEVWVTPRDDFGDFDSESEPTKVFGRNAVVSVADDGTVFVYSPDASEVYRIDTDSPDTVDASPARIGDTGDDVAITSVAGRWVLLDTDTGQLSIEGRMVDLTGVIADTTDAVLQRPSASDDRILVGFPGGVVATTVAGDDPTLLAGSGGETAGIAAPPVVIGDCVFAAWTSGTAWRECGSGSGSGSVVQDLAGMSAAALDLGFVVRGTRVALNDPDGGGTWAVQDDGALISNWDELIEQKKDDEPAEASDPDSDPTLETEQVLPVAVDDDFGARPSRATVLPVLLNDYDGNGDVLSIDTVTDVEGVPGRIDVINDRQQLQITLTASAAGSMSFDYTVSDGRGGTAAATVTVTVRQSDENAAPTQARRSRLAVRELETATTSVLGDWVDPDGDAFYLANAAVGAPDAVTYKPDGTVVFSERGGMSPQPNVSLAVSDGSAVGSGSLTLSVQPTPVQLSAEPFAVTAYAGQETTIAPLTHVRGGSGEVRLSSVPSKPGSTVQASLETGTFRFTSDQVRTHLLEYVVTDGDQTATGRVRIDVLAAPPVNSAPITTPKTVFLRFGATETIDVTASDIDPAGGVLIVTDVDEPSTASGVSVQLIDQSALRITVSSPLDRGPVTFGYRISNGLATSDGSVTVVQIPPLDRKQPPVATDDSATVRTGATIDIPVLANDEQPDGGPLTLDPQLLNAPARADGLAFVSGDVIRYLAPDRTGTFTVDYTVRSGDHETDQTDQGHVSISVREPVAATNAAPVPITVTARVLAGEKVRIPIRLTGIDPDGDSVQLLGQESPPDKGSVTEVGADFFEYEASPYTAGTDSFTYGVIDGLGSRATGTVRIGIAPRADSGRNPVAITDLVTVRPGKTVSIRVLDNDSDPDGGELRITSARSNGTGFPVSVDGEVIDATPPATPGKYSLIYEIENGSGGTSSAFVTVTVDENADPARPQARDTVLTLSDILDRDTIDVDVLNNVFFADGENRSVILSLLPGYSSTAEVTDRKRIRVTVEDQRQIIPFAVANPDDPSAVGYAFVWVPGLQDTLPQLDRTARALTAQSEAPLTIDLNDYVIAVGGRQVRLTDSASVRATHANTDPLVVDPTTLRFTSAAAYFGPASISFTVTDGATADDPDGRVATIVLPITVTARNDQPPVLRGTSLEFEPGQKRSIDLARVTDYEGTGALEYTPTAPPTGFGYTVTGSILEVTADESTPVGSTATLTIGVKAGELQGQSAKFQLEVVTSTRPLARPASDVVIAPRGRTTTIDVLANDQATNPFPDRPLRVLDVRGLDGGALPAGISVTPSADNSRLTVTVAPSADPVDTNLQYQVADATNDSSRYTFGSVRISVQDRPDVPAPPVRADGGYEEGQLTVRIAAPQSNNAPITKYELISTSHGDYRHDCGTELRCALSDLTPGLRYQFSVVATNSVGASDPSESSADVSADYLPAAPASVSARATASSTSGSLAISWSAVANPNPGSAITRYVVRIAGPGVDYRTTVSPSTTSLNTDAGGALVPNAPYTVTVYAQNSALVLSEADWRRTSSPPVTTIGPPSPVTNLTATSIDAAGRISVTWGASDANGAPSVSYRLLRLAEGASAPGCGPDVGTAAASGYIDSGVADAQRVQYAVYADNSFFCTVAVSGAVESKAAPGKATAVMQVDARGSTGQFDLHVRDLGVGSGTAVRYEYNLQGAGWRPVVRDEFITSIQNSGVYGTEQTAVFRGCRDATENLCGPASDPITQVPVNARVTIASCVQGLPTVANLPGDANIVRVRYFYDYDSGADYDGYLEDDPAPVSTETGTVYARLQAEVTVAGQEPRRDPGFSEATCAAG